MGLFNKILKGLGFEEEGEEEVKEPKVKEKKPQKSKVELSALYNLNNLEEEKSITKEEPSQKEENVKEQQTKSSDESLDFEIVKVKCQVDVQNAVNILKAGKRALINIEELSSADLTRSLDFLTGAVFALGLKMQKLDDKIFLIQ